jgi:hypothetical protein
VVPITVLHYDIFMPQIVFFLVLFRVQIWNLPVE